jgi:hypothetical protein
MSTLEEISEDLERELSTFNKAIEGMRKRTIDERRLAIPQYKSRISKIKNLIETFNFQIDSEEASNPNIGRYQAQSREFKVGLWFECRRP